jgi:hypothetical protein
MDDSKAELLAEECVKVCTELGIVDGTQPLTGPQILLIMSDAIGAIHLLKARTLSISFKYETPADLRGRGRGGCAYGCGFESGYRGYELDNPYTAEPHLDAYHRGWIAGNDFAHQVASEMTHA